MDRTCLYRYATHPELNSWTPLIHDEYATLVSQSAPSSQAMLGAAALATKAAPVHLTLDVENLQMKAYASSKLGLGMDASSNRTFVPLRTEMKTEKAEHAGCEPDSTFPFNARCNGADIYMLHAVNVLTKHSLPPLRSDSAPSTSQLVAPLVSLQSMLGDVSSMLDNVLTYVKSVSEGSQQGDARIGRYLLETLASVPMATSSKGQFEEDFNNHLAVRSIFSMLYLSAEILMYMSCAGSTDGLVLGKCRSCQLGSSSSGKYDARLEACTPSCIDMAGCTRLGSSVTPNAIYCNNQRLSEGAFADELLTAFRACMPAFICSYHVTIDSSACAS